MNTAVLLPSPSPRRRRKLKWTEYKHSFHGRLGPDETFIVCLCRGNNTEDFDGIVQRCNTALGLTPSFGQVTWDLTYGGHAFELPWKAHRQAYRVLDHLLRVERLSVFTQTRMCVNLLPAQLNEGDTCTPEWMERVTARAMRQEVEQWAAVLGDGSNTGKWARAVETMCWQYKVVYAHEASWITEEGKALVRWLRSLVPSPDPLSSDEEVYVSDVEDATRKRLPSPIPMPPSKVPRLEEKEEEGTICMICLVQRADTMVLPCGHQVVCRVCSPLLQKTILARKCAYCQQPLTVILQDEQ